MNRIGVALAADSAVTVGGDTRKVFSSADKLFQLSYTAPVGAMVYGSANFLSIPWETLIKHVREHLGATRFPTLKEYGEFLVSFLSRDAVPFTAEYETEAFKRLAVTLLHHVREEMEDALDRAAEEQQGLTEAEVAATISGVVVTRLATIRGRTFIAGFADRDLAATRSQCEPFMKELCAEVFGDLPLGDNERTSLSECVAEMAVRNYAGPFLSGLVIAGFGEDEFLPTMVQYELEERVLGRPRITSVTEYSLGPSSSARIVPFAQRDSVSAFLEGVEPQLQQEMQSSVDQLFRGALTAILDKVQDDDPDLRAALESQLTPGLDEMLKRLFAGWRLMRSNFWRPVINMVAALPKDELAAVAESLVNLTKFRRRITPVHESVGGPIDVAMISKGDGFVWVKRKHYFSPELNPRAMSRIQAGGGH